MATSRLAVIIFAMLSASTSAAVVHQANLRAASTSQKAETVTFSEHLWNNTMTQLLQHEISMTKADPPKVDKVLYVMFAMIFGCCGVDRCFMGQVLLGCLKGFTFGGFLIWHIIDYFVCVYCALSKMEKIDMMGYHATFKPSTVTNAFYACIILLIFQVIQQINSLRMQKMQMEQQKEMQERMIASMTANAPDYPANQQAQQETLNVPVRHQSLAHIPTAFTRALRKAGVVTEKPTIPELIAAFEKMDKNGDGKIDHDELKEGLASMGVSDEEVDAMIKEADVDGDGNIDKTEFLDFYAKKAQAKDEP